MNRADQELVMLHYDGELPADLAGMVARRLAEDPEWLAIHVAIDEVGQAVRAASQRHLDLAPDISGDVMCAIARGAAATPAVRGVRRAFGAAGAVAAVLALAAAVALLLHSSAETTAEQRHELALSASLAPLVELAPAAPARAPRMEATAPLDLVPAVAIESVDFGTRQATIFMVGSELSATPVVWLMDDPSPSSGRMNTL